MPSGGRPAGCLSATAAGTGLAIVIRVSGFFPNVIASVTVSAVVTGVFLAVVVILDGGDARAAIARLRSPRMPAAQ